MLGLRESSEQQYHIRQEKILCRGEQQAFRAALIVSVSGKSNCVQEAPPTCTGNRPRMVLSLADISILINIICASPNGFCCVCVPSGNPSRKTRSDSTASWERGDSERWVLSRGPSCRAICSSGNEPAPLCWCRHGFVLLGVCLPGESHRQDVRLQEAGEEEDQEEERRIHGPEWEADPGKSQQQICRESIEQSSPFCRLLPARPLNCPSSLSPAGELGIRVRDQRRPVPGADHHERRRPEVPHLQHGHAGFREGPGPVLRRPDLLRTWTFAQRIHRLQVDLVQKSFS